MSGVEVHLSPLSGPRKIVDVILSYTNRETDVTGKYFVRVNVTKEFPFLVTKISPFYKNPLCEAKKSVRYSATVSGASSWAR